MSAPADARRQLIDQLAVLVVEDRRAESAGDPRPHKVPYYMLNISHPVLRQFYLDYLSKTGEATPPGDIGRTRFELAMLHPAALRSLAAYYQKQGRYTPPD